MQTYNFTEEICKPILPSLYKLGNLDLHNPLVKCQNLVTVYHKVPPSRTLDNPHGAYSPSVAIVMMTMTMTMMMGTKFLSTGRCSPIKPVSQAQS